MTYVVVEHHLDEEAGLYRLVVGWQERVSVVMTDEQGEVVFGPDTPLLDENGNEVRLQGEAIMEQVEVDRPQGEDGEVDRETIMLPSRGEDGEVRFEQGPVVMKRGEPLTELRDVITAVEDFVFSADDERWQTKNGQRRAADKVAQEQRAIVLDALKKRERQMAAAAEAAAAITHMPGVGGALDGE